MERPYEVGPIWKSQSEIGVGVAIVRIGGRTCDVINRIANICDGPIGGLHVNFAIANGAGSTISVPLSDRSHRSTVRVRSEIAIGGKTKGWHRVFCNCDDLRFARAVRSTW